MEKEKKESVKGYVKLTVIVAITIGVLLIRSFLFDIVTVSGRSMNNNLRSGDLIVVVKADAEITRFDVVLAKVGRQNMIKRVIGLPGEVVEIKDGFVLINGEQIQSEFNYITEHAGVAEDPILLGENEYFLMGDNRSESYDSRDFGAVGHSQIKGIMTSKLTGRRSNG